MMTEIPALIPEININLRVISKWWCNLLIAQTLYQKQNKMSLGALNTFFEFFYENTEGICGFSKQKVKVNRYIAPPDWESFSRIINSFLGFQQSVISNCIRSLDFNIHQFEGTNAIRENGLTQSSERIYLLIHGNELLIRENGLHNSI